MLGMPMMSPFGGLFESMLGNMGSGMSMNMQSSGSGGGQVYSYSSTQVYTSGPNGVYHSSSTSRQGPGGVSVPAVLHVAACFQHLLQVCS